MRAEVKHVEWFDLERLESGDPPPLPTLLVLHVGPVGECGAETFEVVLTTPAALAEQVALDGGVVMVRHQLIVNDLDTRAVERFVRRWVSGLSGDTWPELAAKVGRLGRWEFEDYEEYRDP